MKVAVAVFVAAVITGLIVSAWSLSYDFSACAVEQYNEFVKLSLDHYSSTIDRLFTLSTALVALGSAVLLGLQQAPKIAGARRVIILASTSCFGFASYFALLWQSRLAQSLFLECPRLIADPQMQFPFQASTYFFLAGLILMAVVVSFVAFDALSERGGDESSGR